MLTLVNRRKAATVLVALGPERAAELLRGFDEDEVRELAAEVAEIGHLPAEQVIHTLTELAQELVGRRLAADGGINYAAGLLERVLGKERALELAEMIDPAKVRPFAFLTQAAPDIAATVLAPEPPSSVALALAHLDSKAAARILRHLPADVRGDVALRIASMEHAHAEVVSEVDADFRRRLLPVLEQTVTDIPGIGALVEMLNQGNRETEREVLEAIEEVDPELAARLRDALFTFDDILRLDDRAIQQVLKSVDTRDLATAMKNASDELTTKLLGNLSERARENLVEEIEFLKNVRASDIAEARNRVVRAIRTLEEVGTITIDRGDDE
jgi:flagellar motor switch protein FliG